MGLGALPHYRKLAVRSVSSPHPYHGDMNTQPGHPYPRRILLCVTGLSPQVVTETLYTLTQTQALAFLPTEVHLITTAEGAKRARLALFSDDPGWFRRLLADYHLPDIAFTPEHIHVISDVGGMPLEDIRTPEDNERAADFITETVRELTEDDHTALHASIAGGRKTMGFYLGYALSLFGRPQDRLSHVLVSEPFESSWDFFYPTPYERVIAVRDNKLADARDARVTLADIPLVRLRHGLPERLLRGHANFSATVAAANRALGEPRLVLDGAERKVWADEEPLDIGPTEFVFLLWLAEHRQRDESGIDWGEVGAADVFLAVAARVLSGMSSDYERIKDALAWRRKSPKDLGDYFEPQKSRLLAALRKALGNNPAARYEIQRTGKKGQSRYFLPLAPDQIEIRT
jgi:CRISPR-associated protein (TIGR02584 family)